MRLFSAGVPNAAAGGITDPTDIANLALWLDADDASTFTFTTEPVFSRWGDKSGNSRHFDRTNGNPTRNGSMNGRTTVAFPAEVLLTGSAFNLGNNCTLFAVINRTSGALWDSAPSVPNVWRHHDASSTWEIWDANPSVAHGITNSTDQVVTCRVSVNPTRLVERWIDGANYASSSSSSTTSIAWNTPRIGSNNGGSFYSGEIAEFIIYSAALSDTDRASVESYLSTKWGTP